MLRWSPSTQTRACLTTFLFALFLLGGQVYAAPREQLIPTLGVTTGQNQITLPQPQALAGQVERDER